MKSQFKISLVVCIFCFIFLFASSFLTKRWERPGWTAVLSWDVAGYYLYLPSYFYDHIWHLDKLDYIRSNYNPVPGNSFYVGHYLPNGHFIMKYTYGMAFMYLPGFAIGHIMAKLQGYPVDGFSEPYQFWMSMWGIAFACIGLWVLRKVLIKYFNDWCVALCLLILCLATNYFHYVSFQILMPHTFMFTLLAFIIYFTDRFYVKPTFTGSLILGCLCGLATIARPSDIIFVLIPVLWGMGDVKDLKARMSLFINQWLKLVLFSLGMIAIVSVQLLYWKYITGHLVYWSYEKYETFDFLNPHLIKGIFSYKKGWFTYTPVMVLSLIGFFSLYTFSKKLFWPTLIFSIINIYIVFSWSEWWYGGTFTQRGIIDSYAILLFPIASLLTYSFKKIILGLPVTLFLLGCAWLNLIMTWQENVSCVMENTEMTPAYYWRIFGHTPISTNDKKLLDTDEEMPRKYENDLKVIYTNDFEHSAFADSTIPVSYGHKALLLSKDKQYVPEIKIDISAIKHGWIRAYAKVFAPDREWEVWKQTQFTLSLYNSDKPVKDREIRLYRIIETGKWQEVFVDIKIPEGETVNTLGVKFWNADGDKTMYIDDLRVEAAQ